MLSIKEIGAILKKRLTLIIVILLITTIGAIITTYFIIKPVYTTSATLLIGKTEDSNSGTEYNTGDVSLYKQLMGTYSKVVQSEDLIQRAIERGNLNLTPAQVSSSLTVTPGNENQILTLTYNSKNREEGVEVLNPLIEEFSETSKEIISNGEMFILNTPKLPIAPSSPNKKMNITMGIVLGLVLGVGLALVLEFIDDSIKSKNDIEKLIGIPVIGSVPIYDSEKSLSKRKKEISSNE